MSALLVEFEWNHSETTFYWNDVISGPQSEDGVMNYYLLGINKLMSEGPAIPYTLLNLGVLNLQGSSSNFNENWFTVGLGGGLRYYLNDRLGAKPRGILAREESTLLLLISYTEPLI